MSHGAVDETMWAGEGAKGASSAAPLYLFPELEKAEWWRALRGLARSLSAPSPAAEPGTGPVAGSVAVTYAALLGDLASLGYADPRRGAALVLLGGSGPLGAYQVDRVPAGLLFALEKDLSTIHHVTGQPFGRLVAEHLGEEQPPLADLAGDPPSGVLRDAVEAVETALAAGKPKERLELFIEALGP